MGAALKCHMFDKMGKAALGVIFVQRAGHHLHTHQYRAPWRFIVADDIAHAIGQPAKPEGRIKRHIACRKGKGRRRRARHGGKWRREQGKDQQAGGMGVAHEHLSKISGRSARRKAGWQSGHACRVGWPSLMRNQLAAGKIPPCHKPANNIGFPQSVMAGAGAHRIAGKAGR